MFSHWAREWPLTMKLFILWGHLWFFFLALGQYFESTMLMDLNVKVKWWIMCGCFHFTATTMKDITTNFKLGFGSFVDKAVSPFVRTEYGYLTAVKCILTKLTTSIKGVIGYRFSSLLCPLHVLTSTSTFQHSCHSGLFLWIHQFSPVLLSN